MGVVRTAALWICIFTLGLAADDKTEELSLFQVEDVDFENTKQTKVCIIAQLNATINLTYGDEGTVYKIPIPQDSSLEGSYCDYEFTSVLKLNFRGGSVSMTFVREGKKVPDPGKITYCDLCDYGTWDLTELEVVTELEQMIKIEASMDPKMLLYSAPELTQGIDVKRAYSCDERDRITVIPLDIIDVSNMTSHHSLSPALWNAELVIYLIRVQPFLVLKPENFNDPYLCRDITLGLMLTVIVPLVFFTVFILFYHVKAEYGCPPNFCRENKEKLDSNEDSDSCIEDESTNMASGFSSSFPLTMEGNTTTYF